MTDQRPGGDRQPYYLRPDGTVCETYEAGSVLLSCHPALHPSYVTEDGVRYDLRGDSWTILEEAAKAGYESDRTEPLCDTVERARAFLMERRDHVKYHRADLVRRSICPACGREGRLRVDL